MATSLQVRAMAARVVEACDPVHVILFGSHARGKTHRWSDVDLLVVIPDGRDCREARSAATAALREFRDPRDIIAVTSSQVRQLGAVVGTVFRPALREGKVLYDARRGYTAGDVPALDVVEIDPVTDDERLAETETWIAKTREDLWFAEQGVAADPPYSGGACYHAQQVAEKALKTILVFLQIDYPLTHELQAIRDAIPTGWPVTGEYTDADLEWLSKWAIQARYPGKWEPPTADDAREAVPLARAIFESVLRDLRDHGFEEPHSPAS